MLPFWLRHPFLSLEWYYKKRKGFWDLLKHYGPDLATYGSRDIEIRDARSEAIGACMDDITKLLPRRYQFILEQLDFLQLIDQETYEFHTKYGHVLVMGGSLYIPNGIQVHAKDHPFPWVVDPSLLEQLDQTWLDKITSLEEDIKHAQSALWGIGF